MSLTFINLEESPDHPRTFGLGSGLLEDFLHNPLEQLRTLKWDRVSGSWDIEKIRCILTKINDLAYHNNCYPEPLKMHKIESEEVANLSDFDKLYNSFKECGKFDNRNSRVQQIMKDFKNRVIYKQQRPSSVQPKVILQPQKCKLMSKVFEERLNTINNGKKRCPSQAKSKYMDHFSIDTNRRTFTTDVVRPNTCQSTRRGYSLQREKTFDLDQRHSAQISRRRKSPLEIEQQKQTIVGKLMRKCEKELNKKVDLSKYDLENQEIRPTFMLDDSDSQTKKLSKCINFNPMNSIKHEFRMRMPREDDFIVRLSNREQHYKQRRFNSYKQKVFCAKASNFEED